MSYMHRECPPPTACTRCLHSRIIQLDTVRNPASRRCSVRFTPFRRNRNDIGLWRLLALATRYTGEGLLAGVTEKGPCPRMLGTGHRASARRVHRLPTTRRATQVTRMEPVSWRAKRNQRPTGATSRAHRCACCSQSCIALHKCSHTLHFVCNYSLLALSNMHVSRSLQIKVPTYLLLLLLLCLFVCLAIRIQR